MAIVVPNIGIPHSHPILPATKASIEVKERYQACVVKEGTVGSTVRSVDQGMPHLLLTVTLHPYVT